MAISRRSISNRFAAISACRLDVDAINFNDSATTLLTSTFPTSGTVARSVEVSSIDAGMLAREVDDSGESTVANRLVRAASELDRLCSVVVLLTGSDDIEFDDLGDRLDVVSS